MRRLNKNVVDMLRAKKCMTSVELAKAAGVSPVTLRKGFKEAISLVAVGKVARALEVDIKEIIIEED